MFFVAVGHLEDILFKAVTNIKEWLRKFSSSLAAASASTDGDVGASKTGMVAATSTAAAAV